MIKTLIEQWFPAAAIGAESLRERGSAKAYPPINFLHVWWARRPLTTSRAAVLASILPAWPSDSDVAANGDARTVRDFLSSQFPDGEDSYHRWFLKAVGILGDPVKGRAITKQATEKGVQLNGKGYGYKRAFTSNPTDTTVQQIQALADLCLKCNGRPTVLDMFSGGGSIPFETLRLGANVVANELNPVAGAILEGTIVLPFQFGADLANDIKLYGTRWAKAVETRLSPFFAKINGESKVSYIWCHTVPCPTTGRATPLAPNYWLDSSNDIALDITPDVRTGEIEITVVRGNAKDFGERSTYKNGTGISIWTNEPFDGDYIRKQAQDGNMHEMLLAVAHADPVKRGLAFRAPVKQDLEAIQSANHELARKLPIWESEDLVPTEKRFVGPADRSAQYGLTHWRDVFSPRQLLSNITALEELRNVAAGAIQELGEKRGKAVALYLAFALDKAVDYNSILSSWDTTRIKIRNTFDRHDFSFKWSFAEFEAARELIPWAVNNAVVNHENICALLGHASGMFGQNGETPRSEAIVGSATSLTIDDKSIDAIITDPPYYDNVMYAECSDFFYVWLKRALRDTWPEFCGLQLTDKDREAVANAGIFKDIATHKGSGKRANGAKTAAQMADERYESLLTESFHEAHRVLKDDGVMTVMFTHKRVDAWDTLGMALLESGFCIESSWPVHTESENSLHQAKKNSASSTILLTCRKRQTTDPAFWSDIRTSVERIVEDSVKRFAREGIKGVDLTLATYGPALSVLSQNWPVYTGDTDTDGKPTIIRPDLALDLAREKVAAIKKRGLLGGSQIDFDRQTDWWLLAWNDFQAREFPSPEALKLSIATHLDLEDLIKRDRLLSTTSGTASILTPAQRRAARAVSTGGKTFTTYVDALHTLMLVYEEDGLGAARAWLQQTGYLDDRKFHELVRAAINAVPRSRVKGKFVLQEAQTLDGLRANLFEDIPLPADEPEQLTLVSA